MEHFRILYNRFYIPMCGTVYIEYSQQISPQDREIWLKWPFRENGEKTLALPSRWRIFDNRINLYYSNSFRF